MQSNRIDSDPSTCRVEIIRGRWDKKIRIHARVKSFVMEPERTLALASDGLVGWVFIKDAKLYKVMGTHVRVASARSRGKDNTVYYRGYTCACLMAGSTETLVMTEDLIRAAPLPHVIDNLFTVTEDFFLSADRGQ